MKHTSLRRAGMLLALVAISTASAAAGMPIFTLDQIALGSLMLVGIGEIDGAGLKDLLQKQGEAFEQFKSANDARLAAVEAKGYAPADLVGKVDVINADLAKLGKEIAEIMKKANRPGAGRSDGMSEEQQDHKNALRTYLRKGTDADLHGLERKAMTAGSDPDGGYLVDEEMDGAIDRVAATITSLRSVANVRTIGGASYKKLVKTRGVSGGWVGESEEGGETNSPQFSEIEIAPVRLYAEPWVPNDLLEDAMYDLEADLGQEVGITFGEVEGTAFISGTGVKQPRGILAYTAVANASYAWGKIGYAPSGASGAFDTTAPGDRLITLQHTLKQQYRPGAVFVMSDATLSTVRQMKDGSGQYYLWAPDNTAGFGGRLLGSPVLVDDYMPAIAANSYSIAYGNFGRGYTIVDRRGIAVIRDNVTKKGTTKFHFSKRVGGGVTNFEAIKLLKFASS